MIWNILDRSIGYIRSGALRPLEPVGSRRPQATPCIKRNRQHRPSEFGLPVFFYVLSAPI